MKSSCQLVDLKKKNSFELLAASYQLIVSEHQLVASSLQLDVSHLNQTLYYSAKIR